MIKSVSRFVALEEQSIEHSLVPKNLLGLDSKEDMKRMMMMTPFDMHNLPDFKFTADEDFEDDKLLIDCYGTTDSVVPVSKRVKEYFEKNIKDDIQYIPTKMLDHRGKVAEVSYILHPLRLVDCIDNDASEVELSTIDSNLIMYMEQLVIDESKVPDDCEVFRIPKLRGFILFERTLAEKIQQQEFIGLGFCELEDCSL